MFIFGSIYLNEYSMPNEDSNFIKYFNTFKDKNNISNTTNNKDNLNNSKKIVDLNNTNTDITIDKTLLNVFPTSLPNKTNLLSDMKNNQTYLNNIADIEKLKFSKKEIKILKKYKKRNYYNYYEENELAEMDNNDEKRDSVLENEKDEELQKEFVDSLKRPESGKIIFGYVIGILITLFLSFIYFRIALM